MKLVDLDRKIADRVALIAFYESLNYARVSLNGIGSAPLGHEHFIKSLLEQGKTTFKKEANKSILKKVGYVIAGKTDKAFDLAADLTQEIEQNKRAFFEMLVTRQKMITVINDAKVKAIIKKAVKSQPTVAKARSQVAKTSKKLGLQEHHAILNYLE